GPALLDDRLDQLRHTLDEQERGGEPGVLRPRARREGGSHVPEGPAAVRRDHPPRVREPRAGQEDERGAVLHLGAVLLVESCPGSKVYGLRSRGSRSSSEHLSPWHLMRWRRARRRPSKPRLTGCSRGSAGPKRASSGTARSTRQRRQSPT